jgi:hypothetical protein
MKISRWQSFMTDKFKTHGWGIPTFGLLTTRQLIILRKNYKNFYKQSENKLDSQMSVNSIKGNHL